MDPTLPLLFLALLVLLYIWKQANNVIQKPAASLSDTTTNNATTVPPLQHPPALMAAAATGVGSSKRGVRQVGRRGMLQYENATPSFSASVSSTSTLTNRKMQDYSILDTDSNRSYREIASLTPAQNQIRNSQLSTMGRNFNLGSTPSTQSSSSNIGIRIAPLASTVNTTSSSHTTTPAFGGNIMGFHEFSNSSAFTNGNRMGLNLKRNIETDETINSPSNFALKKKRRTKASASPKKRPFSTDMEEFVKEKRSKASKKNEVSSMEPDQSSEDMYIDDSLKVDKADSTDNKYSFKEEEKEKKRDDPVHTKDGKSDSGKKVTSDASKPEREAEEEGVKVLGEEIGDQKKEKKIVHDENKAIASSKFQPEFDEMVTPSKTSSQVSKRLATPLKARTPIATTGRAKIVSSTSTANRKQSNINRLLSPSSSSVIKPLLSEKETDLRVEAILKAGAMNKASESKSSISNLISSSAPAVLAPGSSGTGINTFSGNSSSTAAPLSLNFTPAVSTSTPNTEAAATSSIPTLGLFNFGNSSAAVNSGSTANSAPSTSATPVSSSSTTLGGNAGSGATVTPMTSATPSLGFSFPSNNANSTPTAATTTTAAGAPTSSTQAPTFSFPSNTSTTASQSSFGNSVPSATTNTASGTTGGALGNTNNATTTNTSAPAAATTLPSFGAPLTSTNGIAPTSSSSTHLSIFSFGGNNNSNSGTGSSTVLPTFGGSATAAAGNINSNTNNKTSSTAPSFGLAVNSNSMPTFGANNAPASGGLANSGAPTFTFGGSGNKSNVSTSSVGALSTTTTPNTPFGGTPSFGSSNPSSSSSSATTLLSFNNNSSSATTPPPTFASSSSMPSFGSGNISSSNSMPFGGNTSSTNSMPTFGSTNTSSSIGGGFGMPNTTLATSNTLSIGGNNLSFTFGANKNSNTINSSSNNVGAPSFGGTNAGSTTFNFGSQSATPGPFTFGGGGGNNSSVGLNSGLKTPTFTFGGAGVGAGAAPVAPIGSINPTSTPTFNFSAGGLTSNGGGNIFAATTSSSSRTNNRRRR